MSNFLTHTQCLGLNKNALATLFCQRGGRIRSSLYLAFYISTYLHIQFPAIISITICNVFTQCIHILNTNGIIFAEYKEYRNIETHIETRQKQKERNTFIHIHNINTIYYIYLPYQEINNNGFVFGRCDTSRY